MNWMIEVRLWQTDRQTSPSCSMNQTTIMNRMIEAGLGQTDRPSLFAEWTRLRLWIEWLKWDAGRQTDWPSLFTVWTRLLLSIEWLKLGSGRRGIAEAKGVECVKHFVQRESTKALSSFAFPALIFFRFSVRVHLSVCVSVCLSIRLSRCQSAGHHYLQVFIYLTVYLSMCLSFSHLFDASIYLFVFRSVWQSLDHSICEFSSLCYFVWLGFFLFDGQWFPVLSRSLLTNFRW